MVARFQYHPIRIAGPAPAWLVSVGLLITPFSGAMAEAPAAKPGEKPAERPVVRVVAEKQAKAQPRQIAVGPQTSKAEAKPESKKVAAVADPKAPAASTGGPEPERKDKSAIVVLVDYAKIVRLPEKARTVIVGNPLIADVTIQANGIMVVTGKSYGMTNLIALDPIGGVIAESKIMVQAANDTVTVQRGLDRESYSCTPDCQPSILLGDSQKHFGEVSGQATNRSSLAASQR
jgi:Flp pilus assembly secretin CpaC